MTKKYLVKLTPHDKFFFGGETTFGEGNVNYFVKSNYFPQQTSLLGLVRYQLLLQSSDKIFMNNQIVNETDAAKLIGEESFKLNNGFNFGAIKSISPVFISNADGNHLFPANKEYQWVDKEDDIEIHNFVFREFQKYNGHSSIASNNNFIPCLEKYNPKLFLPDLLINMDKSIKKFYDFDKDNKNSPHNGIFIKHEQVGIRKNYKGQSEDKAYYIQIFYKLLYGYCLAFILELEGNVNFTSQNIVTLGGEQSKFKMEVTNSADEYEKLIPNYEPSTNSEKVVLVSDAFLTNDIFSVCEFAVTETVDFRSLKSSVKITKNYSAMSDSKTDVIGKSSKFNFFKKGSVFYGTLKDISNKIENKNLQNLGYNIFKPIEKKS